MCTHSHMPFFCRACHLPVRARTCVNASARTILRFREEMSCGTFLAVCAVCVAIMCYYSCAEHARSTVPWRTRDPPMRCVPEVVHVRTLIPHGTRELLTMQVLLAPHCSVTLEASYYYALFDARYDAMDYTSRVVATDEHGQRVLRPNQPWRTRASSSVTLRNLHASESATVQQTLLVKKMRAPLSLLAHIACTSARLALFPYALRKA